MRFVLLLLMLPIIFAAGDSPQNAILLQVGQEVTGISSGSEMYYAVNTTEGIIYTATLTPLQMDLDLRIEDENGRELDFSARGGLANDTIVFRATSNRTFAVVYGQGGQFILSIQRGGPEPCSIFSTCQACSSQTGCGWCSDQARCVSGSSLGPSARACEAVFWVWLPNNCAGAPSPVGTPINSSFDNATEINSPYNGSIPLASAIFYKYSTTQGTYRIRLKPHDGDIDLGVFDNDRNYLGGSRNSGTAEDSLDVESEAGFLYIRLNSLDGSNFTLTIERIDASPTPTASPSPTSPPTPSPTPSASPSPSPTTCPIGFLFGALLLFAALTRKSA